MFSIEQTEDFDRWLEGLADERAAAIIVERIARLRRGLIGQARSLGGKISELKIDYGPGYRLYYTVRDRTAYILLCGGTKRSQKRDVSQAKALAAGL